MDDIAQEHINILNKCCTDIIFFTDQFFSLHSSNILLFLNKINNNLNILPYENYDI